MRRVTLVILMTLSAGSPCIPFDYQQHRSPSNPRSLGVCAAIQLVGRTEDVSLRATGAFSRDGTIVVGDSSCLRGRVEEREETGYLSAYIVIRTEFSEERKGAASRLRWMAEQFPSRHFQLLATGTLTCVELRRADNQTIGNGFGPYGRMPCEFLPASVSELQVFK